MSSRAHHSDTRIVKHNGNTIVISKSNRPTKKYMAVIKFGSDYGNYKAGDIKTVHFGGIKVVKSGNSIKYEPYEQYKDSTGLGLYSKYDHLDTDRRNNYYKRHGWYSEPYSPKYFSHMYLW